ncbi:MAG: LytTR family transcriptional regulator DNA-binding domain-containing protein [Lachnospiraceae bacterium]|nr:LytTR family transcriptional regulator DNA-binding domain-containing protein [Lachnospiraceae bacterium]
MSKENVLNIGICDDHSDEIDTVESVIRENSGFGNAVIKRFTPSELLVDVEENFLKCNIMIMDIYYDGEDFNGIDLAKKINELYPQVRIIFISDFIAYAEKVYEAEHTFFIQKKNYRVFLARALKKCLLEFESLKNKDVIEISSNRIQQYIRVDDILYITKEGRRTIVVTEADKINTISTLSYFEKQDKSGKLSRIHASFIVNLDCIKMLKDGAVVLKDGTELPVSAKYSKRFKNIYVSYWNSHL